MKLSPAERAQQAQFALSYQSKQLPLLQRIERTVCGCDYGGTSWTTKGEAEHISGRLALNPGQRLMDIGAGAGWPGLFLAALSGCDISLVDLPVEGLAIALERAARDRLQGHCDAIVADARALPFDDEYFDAITHSDVLCCLLGKQQALHECRRVLRPGGLMVFSVISIPATTKGKDYLHAINCGPPFVGSAHSYENMAGESGWTIDEVIDVTASYQNTVDVLIAEETRHQHTLCAELGEEITLQRMERNRNLAEIIANGFLRRDIYHVVPK